MKQLVASTLAAAMVLGTGTAALAKDDKSDHQKGWEKNNKKIKLDFRDMQDDDMKWALRYIADLAARQVFDGYDDGSFRPRESVTRIEAIVAAVRLMGLRDQAESAAKMQTKLNFKDANEVPAWAVGYVAVAVENDLFGESETMVRPNQPGDRLWATTLLVKALKLTNAAEAKMNVRLPFADADKIPAGSVGYVAVAVEKGLVNGFDDNTFRPNQPVTRAQIAALLDRAGNQLPGNQDGLVTGTVANPVTGNVLTITNSGQSYNLTLDANVFIYRNGSRVSASALQVGDIVRTRSFNNVVYFVEVTQVAGSTPSPVVPTGVVSGTLASSISGNVLTLMSSGQLISLPLNANALFFRNGVQVTASALQPGDVLTARAYQNAVVLVNVTQTAGSTGSQPSFESKITGTVALPVNGGNSLMVSSGGKLVSLSVSGNAFVYRSGSQTNVSALAAGDVVTVYAYNNVAAIIEVTQPAIQLTGTKGTITGTVAAPVLNPGTLAVTSGGQNYSLQLSTNAFVYRNGVQTGLAALQQGDVIAAHYYNNTVLYAEVTQLAGGGSSTLPSISQVTGTLASVVSGNNLSVWSGGQISNYVLNSNAFIYRGGTQVNASALQAGDVLNFVSYNGTVIFIEVTQAAGGSAQNFTVAGTFNQVTLNSEGRIATISLTQTVSGGTNQTLTYNVASNVTVYGDARKLNQTQPVSVILQGSGQTVTAIYIQ
jgi:hypothetical protein